VQVEAAHRPGLDPELRVVGAVEPAAYLVRADVRVGQDPADRDPGYRQAASAQVTKIPRMPWRANRPRHWRTVFSVQPRSRAIFAFGSPAAAAITILARSTSRCGIVPALMICRSFCSRLLVIRTGTAGGPGIWLSSRTYEPAVLPGGQLFGSAVEACDTAAIVHLTEYAE
jgi:hypothetical protein